MLKLGAFVLSTGMLLGAAQAEEDSIATAWDLPRGRLVDVSLDRVAAAPTQAVRLQRRPVRSGVRAGWVAFHASERTSRAESAPIAAVGDAAASVAATPRFTRNEGDILRGAPWTIELDAVLTRPALAGSAQFVFTDVGDRRGNAEDGNTSTLQTKIERGDRVAAHATLGLEDGFQPGHIYHMRLTQLIRGKQVVLAEGEFQLE